MPSLSPFGEQLRAARKRLGLSQLDLALLATTTPRYVSFIETGRSRPGRDVVLRVAEALQLSLRDRNALLVAAGLNAVFTEHTFDDEHLKPFHSVIERVLQNHNPYPAFAFGPALTMLAANETAEKLFPGMTALTPTQLVEAWCTPPPGENDAEARLASHQLVATLRRELSTYPHPKLPDLLARAEKHAAALGAEANADDAYPVMCPTLNINGHKLNTIATVMRFDKAADITVAELRVELIFPADETCEAFFRDETDA